MWLVAQRRFCWAATRPLMASAARMKQSTTPPSSVKSKTTQRVISKPSQNQLPNRPTRSIILPPSISAKDLARLLNIRCVDLAEKCAHALGVKLSGDPNEIISNDIAVLLAAEYNVSTSDRPIKAAVLDLLNAHWSDADSEDYQKWPIRPPVITIMGHVDHGKTTLLDRFRQTNVAAGEAGGITQHIGAFSVRLPSDPSNRSITFLDTPGHAAFTAMRARGARVTDIVVLVVAADDGVMPQTIEAIQHAKAAQVPIVVAITKFDRLGKDGQDQLNRLYLQLMENGLQPESFGGDVPCVPLSAVTGLGIAEFEETLLTVAEVMELRGKSDAAAARVTVIESRSVKGRGNVASVLVQHGTLRPGAVIVLAGGQTYCKIRQLVDDRNQVISEAGPSTPCEIMGSWNGLPAAGDEGVQVESESLAKQCVQAYEDYRRQLTCIEDYARQNQQKNSPLDPVQQKRAMIEKGRTRLQYLRSTNQRGAANYQQRQIAQLEREIIQMQKQNTGSNQQDDAEGSRVNSSPILAKELLVVVKGDVNGSVEAVIGALNGLSQTMSSKRSISSGLPGSPSSLEIISAARQKVNVKVLFSGIGPFTQSDIDLLVAAKRTTTSLIKSSGGGQGAQSPLKSSMSMSNQLRSSENHQHQIVLVGFNVARPAKQLTEVLQKHRIPLISHNIIYKLMDEVKGLVTGMLTPDYAYEIVGEANVLNIFAISGGKEMIAGCRVVSGSLFRSVVSASNSVASPGSGSAEAKYRILRNDVKVYEGPLQSLKHHKKDVGSIKSGMECGLSFGDRFKDIQTGDVIQCIRQVELPPVFE